MAISIERINYRGWPNCYRISDSNSQLEVVVTTDVGPRIIRCALAGKANLFQEFPAEIGQTGGQEWRMYGGHRLWHSPESQTRTYYPDNHPVEAEIRADGIVLRQPQETTTGIQKELSITMVAGVSRVRVEHRLINGNCWAVTLAPWAITVMKTGGTAIVPQYRKVVGEGLLPNRVLALWPYTEMNDPRVEWGSRYIRVTQDPERSSAFKIGLSVPEGWLAYHNQDCLFVKQLPYLTGAVYPDGGVNAEIYTNNRFLEVESLGALQTVEPGDAVTHIENWFVYQNVPKFVNETDIDDFFNKNVCIF
ncbi:MAG TPA: hypothetical protein VIM29_09070 [Bacillota bacterium]